MVIDIRCLTNLYSALLQGTVYQVYAYSGYSEVYYLDYCKYEISKEDMPDNYIYLGAYGNYYTFYQLRESLRTRIALHYYNIKLKQRKEKIRKCFKRS